METIHNDGLGLRAAVWLNRSNSVSAGLGSVLKAGPVCDDSTAEDRICENAALYK